MSDNKKPKIFFIHLRPNHEGSPLLNSRSHGRTPPKGGRTVAFTYDDKGVQFAVAKVNPNDVYDKSIGRKVSSERLLAGVEGTVGCWPGSVNQFRRAVVIALMVD
ncbi:MAG: hypothetical protein RR877_10070 [Aurantimicrobium sp.]|uniref:hypothetical protein n=1 Tax=Aurantimicrobium sp. TaxID=1930784 RepID=UPI002FC6F7B6